MSNMIGYLSLLPHSSFTSFGVKKVFTSPLPNESFPDGLAPRFLVRSLFLTYMLLLSKMPKSLNQICYFLALSLIHPKMG